MVGASLSEPHIVVTAVAIVAIVVMSDVRALSVHITSPHVLRTWSWNGLAWVRVVHFRVWLNEDRDAEQKTALESSQARKTSGQSSDAKSGRNLQAAARDGRGAGQQL